MPGTNLLIVLVLLLLGALPTYLLTRGWAYAPTGGLSLVLAIVLIWVLMGRIWKKSKDSVSAIIKQQHDLGRHGNLIVQS